MIDSLAFYRPRLTHAKAPAFSGVLVIARRLAPEGALGSRVSVGSDSFQLVGIDRTKFPYKAVLSHEGPEGLREEFSLPTIPGRSTPLKRCPDDCRRFFKIDNHPVTVYLAGFCRDPEKVRLLFDAPDALPILRDDASCKTGPKRGRRSRAHGFQSVPPQSSPHGATPSARATMSGGGTLQAYLANRRAPQTPLPVAPISPAGTPPPLENSASLL